MKMYSLQAVVQDKTSVSVQVPSLQVDFLQFVVAHFIQADILSHGAWRESFS